MCLLLSTDPSVTQSFNSYRNFALAAKRLRTDAGEEFFPKKGAPGCQNAPVTGHALVLDHNFGITAINITKRQKRLNAYTKIL
jgi:hypothetical protein